MSMGFGCNAAGVVGCRIIDSPRERMLAILTNAFVPCNGRFPALILLLTVFLVPAGNSAAAALGLTGLVLLGVGVTMGVSKLLSVTVLRGLPSAFTLELPPFRRPRVGRVIVQSVFDRTLYVLARAAAVAAPAGLLLWILGNVEAGGNSLLEWLAVALDPVGTALGMSGVIMAAFLLGFPANEIVLPVVVLVAAGGFHLETETAALGSGLQAAGVTAETALCMAVFFLFHWPCSTTCITIYRETRSAKWTLAAIALPTAVGAALCLLLHGILG